ncbi:MAG: hypothetical protein NC489_37880 [Ruminococcus flavefaciens]|nr:hypothetical protein [Ruminococcus flavefaciens]
MEVKVYESRRLAVTKAMPDPSDLICTAVSETWANRIADALAREGISVELVTADGKKLESDI